MAEVRLDAVTKQIQDFFNKGFAAFERGRLDYAIDMLSTCLEMEPALLQARKFLRAAEVQRYRNTKTNVISRATALASSAPAAAAAAVALKGKDTAKALRATDELLKTNPLHKPYVFMFAHAAEKVGIPEAAIQLLEIAKEQHPDDGDLLQELGIGFQEAGDAKNAIACFEKICEMRPNDPKAVKQLKDAMALDTLNSDGWEQAADEGGTFRDIIKDTDEAVRLEQAGKAVKSEKDVEDLIADNLAKIEEEPRNVNYHRALSRLYVQKKDYDNAIDTLQKALEHAPGDPEVENSLVNIQVQRLDDAIKTLEQEGKQEDAAEKVVERDQLVFDSLQDRVARYPNDLDLRYKFGQMLFENDYFNEAIQQFQMSQRSPKLRSRSLYFLGMCFRSKEQYDLAAEQLETAAGELRTMDDTKKDICYALGEIAEVLGDGEKAAGYFKQIYQVDIQYRDIAEKVEKGYSSQS